MWPLEVTIAMNREHDPIDPRQGRQGADPVRGFLRRKALLHGGFPKGEYQYVELDGQMHKIAWHTVAMLESLMLPFDYQESDSPAWTIKIDIGNGTHTIYWRDYDE